MKQTIHGVITAVIKDNKILLIKRIRKPYTGYWAIPGGIVEEGETGGRHLLRTTACGQAL